MASELSFQEPETYFGTDGDSLLKQKWGLSASTMAAESSNGCFECNICLDSAHDPVVTLCGHLYCWPCIYKWLHIQRSSPDIDQQEQNCPVCKANISYTSLIPLYGRGTSSDSKAEKSLSDISIPQRPLPVGASTMVSSSPNQQFEPNLFQEQNIATASIFNPYGEMVYARIFGSSDPALFAYSYPFVGSGGNTNPRMRRQEMQLDKSLNRVSVFLFCCFVLCLLLF